MMNNSEELAGPAWKYLHRSQKLYLAQLSGTEKVIQSAISNCFHRQNYPPKPNIFLTMLKDLGIDTPQYLLNQQTLLSCHTRIEKEAFPKNPKILPNTSVINTIIQAELFDNIPAASISEITLCTPDANGNTALHYLARTGELGKIDSQYLTEANMLLKNNQGCTPLYNAVIWGFFCEVPKKALTTKTLAAKPEYGDTVIDLVTAKGLIIEIPEDVLEQCNISKMAHILAQNGTLTQLPKKFLTRDVLLYNGKCDIPFHPHNPSILVTSEDKVRYQYSRMRNQNVTRSTLSVLAHTEKVAIVTQGMTTSKDWLAKDSDGHTPISLALGTANNLRNLPPEAYTPEVLLHKYSYLSEPVLLYIIKSKQTANIPKEALQNALIEYQSLGNETEEPLLERAIIAADKNYDIFLGLEIPEQYRDTLGEEWWAINEGIKSAQAKLHQSLQPPEIDIF